MAILAALGGALSIGSADFLGGICARRSGSVISALWINLVALACLALAWVFVQPTLTTDRVLGALGAGVMNAVGMNLIYAAFAAGAMSIVAPMIACGSALVPTAVATAVGNAPSTPQSIGIGLALIGAVSITWTPRGSSQHAKLERRGVILTVLAALSGGASFSILLLSTRGGDAHTAVGVAGVARLAATVICLGMASALLRGKRVSAPPIGPVLGAGGLDAAGMTLLLVSSTLGNAAVSAVIVSLYAIVTVLLAQIVLGERIAARQMVGIGVTVIGVALMSIPSIAMPPGGAA